MVRGSTLARELRKHQFKLDARMGELLRETLDKKRELDALRLAETQAWERFAMAQMEEGVDLPSEIADLIALLDRNIAEAQRTIEEADIKVAGILAERIDLEERLEQARAALRAERESVEDRVARDEAITALVKERTDLAITLEAVSEKLRQAEEDALRKGRAYEEDELFVYLHRRHYGTADYTAFGPFRALDRWLADLIGYREAKHNYERLKNIPKWIAERAETISAKLSRLDERIVEARRRYESSLVPFDDAVREAEKAIEGIDAAIKNASADREKAAKFLVAVASGNDPLHQRIVTDLIGRLAAMKKTALRGLADRTRSQDDDKALVEIERISQQRMKISSDVEKRQSVIRALEHRLAGIEDVLMHMRDKGWEDAEFSLASWRGVLEALATGHLGSREVLDMLRSAHRDQSSSVCFPERLDDLFGSIGGNSGRVRSTGGGVSGSEWSTGGGFGGGGSSSTRGGF